MEKKTPLYDLHVQLGGKIVPFAGYLLPVQYPTGLIAEHMAVRQACGLFDVSHMGQIVFTGPDALSALQHICTNDLSGMDIGRVRYTPICNERGGIVDDLIVCKMAEDQYMLVVNAANKDKDIAWCKEHAQGDVEVEDQSDNYALLALQGPSAPAVLKNLTGGQQLPEKYYTFLGNIDVAGVNCTVSRTGYTGELGYELFCAPEDAMGLMEGLLEAGKLYGLIPCGLGARDTLRLEAGMPLYGHEMSDDITPLEANLGFFVKLDKPEFIGKEALVQQGEPKRIRVGFEITDRGIARENSPVFVDEQQVGVVTSGTMLPFLGKAVGMALIDRDYSKLDQPLQIEVRGKKLNAHVIPLPFYKRATNR